MLEAIRYQNNHLEILDQLLLPAETKYIPINTTEDAWDAINTMKIRGAPAIAIVGALSLAVELFKRNFATTEDLDAYVADRLDYLVTARPTAVNMKGVAEHLKKLSNKLKQVTEVDEMKAGIMNEAQQIFEEDVAINKELSFHGAQDILKKQSDGVCILTHCNTGSLATAGYGTALGVVRTLHAQGKLEQVYFTETRPYNQGSRLTAYELVSEKIPASLICDNMVAALMLNKKVSAVVVGADRVVANGDTANKIGTYQIAVCAKHHGVPFYVASPVSTIDMTLENGTMIPIEERPAKEMTTFKGIPISPEGVQCWNPAFDVTPAELITGIITEKGVFQPSNLKSVFE